MMKSMKQLLFTAMMLGAGAASAQQGSFFAGGSAGFSTNTQKSGSTVNYKSVSWSFSPEVGTYLTDRVQLGVGLTLNGAKQEFGNVNINRVESINYGGTIYGRYLFGELPFKPFVGVNLTALPGKSTSTNDATNISTTAHYLKLGANANVGFLFALSPRFTAYGSFGLVGYNVNLADNGGGYDDVQSGFTADLNTLGNRFTIGIYYTFAQGKSKE